MQEQMSDILSDNQGRETTGNKTPTTNLAIQISRDILPMPSVEIANHNQMSEIISKNTCQFSVKYFKMHHLSIEASQLLTRKNPLLLKKANKIHH